MGAGERGKERGEDRWPDNISNSSISSGCDQNPVTREADAGDTQIASFPLFLSPSFFCSTVLWRLGPGKGVCPAEQFVNVQWRDSWAHSKCPVSTERCALLPTHPHTPTVHTDSFFFLSHFASLYILPPPPTTTETATPQQIPHSHFTHVFQTHKHTHPHTHTNAHIHYHLFGNFYIIIYILYEYLKL